MVGVGMVIRIMIMEFMVVIMVVGRVGGNMDYGNSVGSGGSGDYD